MEKAGVHWGAVTIYSHVHSLINLKDTQGHLSMLTADVTCYRSEQL